MKRKKGTETINVMKELHHKSFEKKTRISVENNYTLSYYTYFVGLTSKSMEGMRARIRKKVTLTRITTRMMFPMSPLVDMITNE